MDHAKRERRAELVTDLSALQSFKFGDSDALADRLAALVVAGVKTGTCSAAVHGPDAEVGERAVCLSSAGKPVCIIETVSIERKRFDAVTKEEAALEGEGDLSYEYWRGAHIEYYKREGTWAADMEVYFETFKLIEILDDDFAANAAWHVAEERAGRTIGEAS